MQKTTVYLDEGTYRRLKRLAKARRRAPAAILPEVDYLLASHLGAKAQSVFLIDLAEGAYAVDWGQDEDLTAAQKICARYPNLGLGFVDAMVIAAAERLKAEAIATLDLRHFASVAIRGNPRLLPRDATT